MNRPAERIEDAFRTESRRVTAFFDQIAPQYRADYADELDRKPFDREFLGRAAARLRGGPPVLEVGAGPAHIGAVLAGQGVQVVASDASAGQLAQARIHVPRMPLIGADLAGLPVRAHSLGGIVGFYCLIYGPPGPLDRVFAGWHRALVPGGLTVIAVHSGTGTVPDGNITVVQRDGADLTGRLDAAGFAVEECTIRPAYQDEWPTERMYIMARSAGSELSDLLSRYRPRDQAEAADVDRVRALVQTADDPWPRSIPLHVTASAVIVNPDSGELLLRWHQRQQAWLQVGGHGDPGETSPLAIALREAREETGLTDLVPWPAPELRHVVIVRVPAGGTEPAHEHADLRFVLATRTPEAARPESPDAPLRWVTPDEAYQLTSEPNLMETVARVRRLLTG